MRAEEKVRRATYVIDTDGTFEDTDAQVDAVVQRLLSP
jgi:dephospho-CoA kinase